MCTSEKRRGGQDVAGSFQVGGGTDSLGGEIKGPPGGLRWSDS